MIIRKKGMVDMQNILAQFAMQQLGFGPVGEIRLLHGGSGNAYNYFRDKINEANMHQYVSQAEAAMVTQRNDVMLVTPDSHAWRGDLHATGAALTWDKTNCHMIGLTPGEKSAYMRARFGHSGYTMANFMTVSGAANLFKNLRWMHGSATGGASDVTCLTVTGAGNIYDHCNFAGPMDATQAATAAYLGVVVSGSSNHFKSCSFGTSNFIDRAAANAMLKLSGTGQLNVFEDCIFWSHANTTTPFFINWASSECASFSAIFLNCKFLNTKAAAESALAYAITDSSHANCSLFFDERCVFTGTTDIIALASETKVMMGGANPDTTAIGDDLALGLAQNPNVS